MRTYIITKPPEAVKAYFEDRFPPSQGNTFQFYWYKGGSMQKGIAYERIYGCKVSKDGKLYHYATQARLEWFVSKNILTSDIASDIM